METVSETVAGHSLRPGEGVLARRMAGGAVIVHLESNRIFELNETGARIWELLAEGLDRSAILQRLVEEFQVDSCTADRELGALLDELERAGLLSLP